jgi:hypothetical protein
MMMPIILPTTHLVHNPGEKTQVDYADGIPITEAKSGKKQKTHLFCAVLPFSSYTFGEFVQDQKLPSFIRSHQHTWAYIGGVTPYVVIDNLKAGVNKAHIYDPDVNQTYCDYGNHDGFSVLPARPYKPRDKAAIEAAIGAIQRSFYQEVRERTFYSLHELNRHFRQFLGRFNNSVMKEYGVSRAQRFENERQLLKPIPPEQYEIKTWRIAKVHPDSTIQVEKNYYSVPFRYISQVLRVRIGRDLIEVFTDTLDSVACHQKFCGTTGQKALNSDHFPSKKEQNMRFDITKARAQAQAIGPKMKQLVDIMFDRPRPLENLRRVQGMLRYWKHTSQNSAAMEYAASQCLTFHRHRVDYFKNCVQYYIGNGNRPVRAVPIRAADEVYLHQTTIKEDLTDAGTS